MVKYLFIFINSLFLFVYGLFSGDNGITVSSNIPASMAPGVEVPVELRVKKGGQSGFAKLQLDLPAGFNVKQVEDMGANYSFDDGIAKWVWASLPTDDELVVKCILIPDKDVSGPKTIGAKYSYVGENNEKKVVEMTPVEVTISGDATAGNIQPANTQTTEPSNSNTTAPVDNTQTQPTVAANSNSEPSTNISVARTITKVADGEYQVDLKINKGLTKGFARYSDDLASELNARAVKTEGASFSVADGKLKFVWVNAPEKEIVEIAFIISGITKPTNVNGEYSYLEQNLSKTYNLPYETINPEPSAAANTNTTAPTETTAANTNTESTAVNTNTENAANTNTNASGTNTETTAKSTETVTPPTEVLPQKSGNVNYMVQIGAFTNSAVSAARLKKKFNISENIKSEMQGGYSKFMVGDHGEYKSARDHREKVKNGNGVQSAFVVAYNTGRRITVQEALMITNQKWFK